MPTVKLDMIQTVALAAVVLYVGYSVRRRVAFLDHYNIPAPVVGGFLFAAISLVLRVQGILAFEFDTTLQSPLMIAFFTTIGLGASLTLLKVGGPLVLLFFLVSTLVAVLQNVLGVGLAYALDLHPLFGVLAGSVTLTGGPATGLAFAPEFARAGVPAAAEAAVAAAMVGIVSGGIIGGPVGTILIRRHRLGEGSAASRATPIAPAAPPLATQLVEARVPEPPPDTPKGEDPEAFRLLKTIGIVLVAMGLGVWLSAWLSQFITLPAYIGAMLVAAGMRNVDDVTGAMGMSQQTIDDLGNIALSLFIAMALMTLRLWLLAALAVPLALILAAQVLLIGVIALAFIYYVMGRNYDAAVMASGFCGFMLGTTANAMANMESIVAKYGPAPRAYLVVPMVGAFFIDFTNAIVITGFLNYFT